MVSEQQVSRMAARRKLRASSWTYATVTGLFLGLFGAFVSAWERRRAGETPAPHPYEFGLQALAAYRIARIIAHEPVAQFIRAPFVERQLVHEPDGSEKIEEVPRGVGLQQSIGQLLTCSWCTGVWAAAAFFYGWFLAPRLVRPFVYVFALAGAQLIADVLTELSNKANLWFQGHT